MRTILKTLAVLAVTTLAGCAKDVINGIVEPNEGEITTVSVGLCDTKTYLGELVDGSRKVYWSENDQISINGNASASIKISESMRSAEFAFAGILNYPYSVLYPASDYVDDAHINLPSVQESADGTFAAGSAPMACVADEGDAITLHHLTSVVRLQVKLPADSDHTAHDLAKVEFSGKAGEQVCGKFAIDYASATITPTSTAEADKVLTAKVGKTLSTDEATDVFVVVPAGEYAQGFTVRLIDKAGHYMDIATGAITLVKGDIKAMPAFEFVPTSTLVGVQISSAQEWNDFVTAYNAGNYAETEDVIVNITNDLVFDPTTCAAFKSVTGFKHTLDGGNFAIKGLDVAIPLFDETVAGSIIKNLTIDSSCSITAKQGKYYQGSFARINRGSFLNCANKATITVMGGAWTHHMYIGGLLGSNQGTITDCYNSGNITFEEVEINSRYLRLGGLVGINEGAAAILRSTNHGAIILAGSNGTSQHNYIGGIVGQTDGSISECVNNGAISGTFKSSYHKVGGIVGYVSSNAASDIVGNTNKGNITQYIPDAARVFVGGIAGHVIELKSKFERNTNSASVSISNGTSYVYVGGCIGWLQKAITGTFKNNSVTNNVAVTCTSASSTTGVGGLIGSSNDGAVIDLAGDMGVIAPIVTGGNSASEDNHVGVGGIVGFANNKVTVKNVTNWTGTINADQSIRTNANCVGFGGIFGYASGGVLIENCTSDGNLRTNIPDTFAGRFAFGGIIGMCKGACEFTNCTNNTVLSLSAQPTVRSNDAPIYIGGIIGWGISGDITIGQCKNTKGFNNQGHNCRVISNDSASTSHQTANYTGGIIGAYGVNDADGALNISDCSSVGDLTSFAGAVGGIAGYVRNATITKCTNSQSLITSGGITGGIVAHASDSQISNCISKCNTSGTVNRGSIPHTGGIVGLVHGSSSIEGCSFFGQLAFTDANNKARYGAISGYTSDNSVVRKNMFGGVVCNNEISDSNFSDYTANVLNAEEDPTDVNPTIEGNNSYWDGN